MTAIHTRHTALMIGTGSAKATFLKAHPIITEGSSDFTNSSFNAYASGVRFLAIFRFSGSRRFLMSTTLFSGSEEAMADLENKQREEARVFAVRFPEEHKRLTEKVTIPVIETKQEAPRVAPIEVEPTTDLTGGSWMGDIYILNRDIAMFDTMISLSEDESTNVLMIGPSGCGKTSIPEAIAKRNGMKFLRMNCAVVRDPEEWFGYREAVDGSTVFVPTEFTSTVREGNCVIVLDEFNRVEPWLHNSLMPLLDHAGETVIHNEHIARGPRCLFVATINRGSRFTGTFMLDAAVLNRMSATLYVGYLDEKQEVNLLVRRNGISNELSTKIVKIMTTLRKFAERNELDVDVSTRSSLKVAAAASKGRLPLDEIINYVILNLIDDSTLVKGAIDAIAPILRS